MEWDRREDGDLQLAIVRGFEMAVADSEVLGVMLLEQARLARPPEGQA